MNMQEAWWKEYFGEDYPLLYSHKRDKEKSAQEVDFIEKALGLPKGARILDLCCGYGRHSLELSRRGYEVLGLDLSEIFLHMAREEAGAEGLKVDFVRADMRHIPFKEKFDAVINIYTSFGYFEDEEENQAVLNEVCRVLKKGGRFLFDSANKGHFPGKFKRTAVDDYPDKKIKVIWHNRASGGNWRLKVEVFEQGTRRERFLFVRLYDLEEFTAMLEAAGLKVLEAFGDLKGTPYKKNSLRLSVLSEKR
jgi:SAM-dependent methyltransferase